MRTSALLLTSRALFAVDRVLDALNAWAAWVLCDWACAHCGNTHPRRSLTLVPPLGTLCGRCVDEHQAETLRGAQ